MTRWAAHIVIDVEADGPAAGLYNMISFGLVSLVRPTQRYLGEVAPILESPGVAEARKVVGVSFEAQRSYRAPGIVMAEAAAWLKEVCGAKRPVFWSDNPGFDWQYWNWYCWKYLGENPAGFSARRIGDLDAGRRGEPLNTNAWKKRRDTAHTHNPVDDALGNVEALRWMLEQMGEKFE